MNVHRLPAVLPSPAARPAPPIELQIDSSTIQLTQAILRQGSMGEKESICLWAGRPADGQTAVISHVIEPKFESTANFLTVPSDERYLVTQYLRRERILLFADLHTHPTTAFLSFLDQDRPFSTRDGLYAFVVPDFANGKPGTGWRLFEIIDRRWREVAIDDRVRR
jgi:hypothetical protein